MRWREIIALSALLSIGAAFELVKWLFSTRE